MTSPLSNELFFQVHRGMSLHQSETLDTKNLGMHWSASKDKAEEIATRPIHWPDRRGYVYHGNMPMSSVETGAERLRKRGFAGFGGKDPLGEKEVPAKENAPVEITGRTTYRRKMIPGGSELKERTRTYKPARQMKA